jgi:hypothetical protein
MFMPISFTLDPPSLLLPYLLDSLLDLGVDMSFEESKSSTTRSEYLLISILQRHVRAAEPVRYRTDKPYP